MALITLAGEPGCHIEDVARALAHRLGWQLVSEARVARLLQDGFGSPSRIPDKAYAQVVLSVLAKLATEHHLVTSAAGSELLTHRQMPAMLRVHVVAPEPWRVGSIMLDRRLDRTQARAALAELDSQERTRHRARIGRAIMRPQDTDIVLNAATLDPDAMAASIAASAEAMRLTEAGLLSPAAEAHIQFRVRLELARHGMTPPDRLTLKRAAFVHPSEQMFASLLDFYRIAWEYEPKSFPIQWDKEGRVTEAFTPDFYLPEFDVYVEVTTMKQAHVTKKNRKIKLVKQLYPDINVQVFYQKDFENLIFKHGLAERASILTAAGAVEA